MARNSTFSFRSPSTRATRLPARLTAIRVLAFAALAFGVAACNSTSLTDGLGTASTTRVAVAPEPISPVGGQTALAPEPGPTPPQAAVTRQGGGQIGGGQIASVQRIPAVAFLPVTGAPQSAVTDLAAAMREAARANSVPVVVSVERGAKYQVKGYFSALNDGSGTVLVYVWDVLDARGVRVHRISGQERGGGSSGDPWAGIGDAVINRVASATMSSLRTWASTRPAG